MNENRFKYKGLEYEGFVFFDKNNKRTVFNKCRKELLEDFKLEKEEFVNEWFSISYFITKSIEKNDLSDDVLIISDMKLIIE